MAYSEQGTRSVDQIQITTVATIEDRREIREGLAALIDDAPGFSCDDVMPLLSAMPQVRLCHSVAGELDLLVLVQADTPSELADLRERVAGFKGVDDVTTVPVLRTTLDRR